MERKPAGEIPSVLCEGAEVNRLIIALGAYVVLGILAWMTLSDSRIRFATLAILALFAIKTIVRRKDAIHSDQSGNAD